MRRAAAGCPAAASRGRAVTCSRLPDGARGAGQIEITLTADALGAVSELNASGNAETNNSSVLTLTSAATPYPDLKVISLQAPASARGGDSITLQWTVTNTGPADATQSPWSDRILLSQDSIIGNAGDFVLATFAHTGGLASGASYTASQSVTVPMKLNGTWYLSVITDALSQVIEPGTRADNTLLPPVPIALAAPYADLQVEVAVGPAQVIEGTSTALSWRVRNLGDSVTDVTQWKDAVYLSTDTKLDAGDTLLALMNHSGAVGVGESYTVNTSVQAPYGVPGNYYFLIHSDTQNQVYEGAFDGNNIGATLNLTQIKNTPAPDLSVQTVSGPTQAAAGDHVTVNWSVGNVGEAAANGSWLDRVYLSTDGTITGALLLASVTHSQALLAGANYSASANVTLPDWADGSYRFVVVSDSNQQVYEYDREANNTAASGALTLVHPNLAVTALTVPASAQSADSIDIQWTVTNLGSSDVTGTWIDRVYLSQDGVIGAGDRLLGEFGHSGPLAPQAGYTGNAQVTLPVELSGDWRIIVRTDAAIAVHEANAENDNQAVAAIAIDLAPYADLQVSDVTAPTRADRRPGARHRRLDGHQHRHRRRTHLELDRYGRAVEERNRG